MVYPSYGYAPHGYGYPATAPLYNYAASGHGRNDHYYRDASSDLHSATGCLRILQLRAQLLGRIRTWPSRVLVALKTRVSQIYWRTLRNAGTTERAREVRFDSVDGRFYYGHVVA